MQETESILKVAHEDIISYKMLLVNNNKQVSPFYGYNFPLNKKVTEEDFNVFVKEFEKVIVGFNSYKDPNFAKQNYSHLEQKANYHINYGEDAIFGLSENPSEELELKLFKAIIPAGSTYFEGDNNYISESLIITGYAIN